MKFPMKKWIKEHKKTAIGIFCAVDVVILLVVVLGFLTLTRQTAFPRPEITPEDWMYQSRVVMRGMQQVMQAEPGVVQEMKLRPEEVAALLKFAVNNDQIRSLFSGDAVSDGVRWTIRYGSDGKVHAALLADSGWGLRSVVSLTVQFRYAENAFTVTPLDCRIGSLRIPNSLVSTHVIPQVLEKLEENSSIQMFHQAVESITCDEEGNLVIRYIPDYAKMFAQSMF